MRKKILNVLFWLWQAPQHIVAACVLCGGSWTPVGTYKGKKVFMRDAKRNARFSLGNYLFVEPSDVSPKGAFSPLVAHEYGHSVQSAYLGWAYLIIIGLPGVMAMSTFSSPVTYHRYFTEAWADKLGGVRFEPYKTRPCDGKLVWDEKSK